MKFSFHTSYSRHSYLRIVVGMTLMKSHVIDCSDISTKLPSSELDELSRQDVYQDCINTVTCHAVSQLLFCHHVSFVLSMGQYAPFQDVLRQKQLTSLALACTLRLIKLSQRHQFTPHSNMLLEAALYLSYLFLMPDFSPYLSTVKLKPSENKDTQSLML